MVLNNKILKSAIALFAAFILFTVLIGVLGVKTVIPAQVYDGEAVSEVVITEQESDDETCFDLGLAGINTGFFNAVGYHSMLEKLTKLLGYIALLTVALFGAYGAYQLITAKSLKGVDTEIIILGVFYVVVLVFYVLFEKLVINYRPVVFDEGLEASYPSSHTMLVIAVMLTAPNQLIRILGDRGTLIKIIKPVCYAIIAVMVIGRLLSGVHWLTDIIGGVILSLSLVKFYEAVMDIILGEDTPDRNYMPPAAKGVSSGKKGGAHLAR